MPEGEELLVVDSAERDRDGLRTLFDGDGYVCTVTGTMGEARELVQSKFFPVAVVELDFGAINGGLELVRFIREKSRPTKIVLLTARRAFEAAIEALRLGVSDVVPKRPDQVAYLRTAVRLAVDQYRVSNKDSSLLREVRSVLEEVFKIMMTMARRIYQGSGLNEAAAMRPMILIIDQDQSFLQEVAKLVAGKDWEVSIELSGGAGLDKASTFSFEIVAVCEQLTDLPGQMLIKSLQSQPAKPLGLLYSKGAAGRIDRYEDGRVASSDRPFSGPSHLVEQLERLVEELIALRRDRSYLLALRSEYGDFLNRYAELKDRIDSLST
jgi:DNA-binding response OmpR family regulator